ncbi:MAG: hypothetical protein DWQ02_17890 [Bacteroidetes bacterium]|nr:MAG: hypothetical protein DWQ02_17890 [Bacteroidota bacterium]
MKHLIENTFLLIMIVVGGIGMAFSFTSTDITKFSGETEKVVAVSIDKDHPQDSETNWNSFLKVRGIKEAGSRMQFEINSFNSNANYLIDFGNGEKKHLKSKNQQYTYKNSGDFNLRLFITYNGKTKLVHSEVLNIDNQVVASANMASAN